MEVNRKKKLNVLDGVLALSSAIRQGSKRQRLSQSELVDKTKQIWNGANDRERQAMMIVGGKSPIFDPNLKPVPMEARLILETISGPEPKQDAKISFNVDNVVAQYKEIKKISSQKLTGKIRVGKTTVIFNRSSLGLRAEAVLATPELRKSLFESLKRQKVKKEKPI